MDPSEAILVLTTGGTIDQQYLDALSRYQVGESTVWKIFTSAYVTHPFRVEELPSKDSLDLTDEDRACIVGRVRGCVFRRIVITHRTDTMMADTARALDSVALENEFTIVLTGALAQARFSESDAVFNLGMAFATAQTAPPGVYVTMNGTVFRGHEVIRDRQREALTQALGRETWVL